MSNDFGDWYRGIPQVTRWWFTASVVLPLLGRIGVLDPMWMILAPQMIINKFQIWRPVTALFYYPIMPQTGFHYLLNLYFLYSYSIRLESGTFLGKTADYLFALIFMWICNVIVGIFANMQLLMDPMVMSVLYVWCTMNWDVIVQFWFGTQFKAMYLPWVLFLFNLIIRGGGIEMLLGILVGHLYFFLAFKYPQDFGGRQLINTPQFLYNFFPPTQGGLYGFGQAPPSAPRPGGPQRHAWGRGNALGDG